ncbi:hypothetical protein OY671_004547 [Metschnikowia pulcherrima]|nr:hypothetical protein OY671_004547 [Metschnikowia pulcherrima]
MARIKRKGKTGAAKNFVTRSAAIGKLQVTLADFRRLCIFKGIFPREPRNKKKANKGSTKNTTFYYAKDIQYLMHEPVLAKFREHKTFAKKLDKALSKNELSDADRLEKARPKYTLDHLVRERYPSFMDALRDLDDPLNMLFLFANMPATDRVSHRVTKDAERLTNQWLAYVAKERLIKKVFVSIKGVYYQANVKGQEVRWLVPFKFPTNIPSDIDFKIMLTFLEFYSTMLHFVLYKLYADADLVYPPPINTEQLKGIGGLSSYVLKSKQDGSSLLPNDKPVAEESAEEGVQLSQKDIAKAKEADAQEETEDSADVAETVETVELDEFASANKNPGDLLNQPSQFSSPSATLFANFTFFVGREVPLDILELCILSAGGKVVSEIALDELKLKSPEAYAKLDLASITHSIVDRPKVLNKVAGRTYIQPQWVFDSINKGELVSVSQYAVGETLPPHLSPWGDSGNYNPEAPAQDQESSEEEEEEEVIEGEELPDEDEEDVEEDEDLKQQKELELEAAGIKYSDAKTQGGKSKKSKKPQQTEADEEKELKTIMMNKKSKKLYDRMQHGIDKRDNRVDKLAKKRKQIEKTKKQLEKL